MHMKSAVRQRPHPPLSTTAGLVVKFSVKKTQSIPVFYVDMEITIEITKLASRKRFFHQLF